MKLTIKHQEQYSRGELLLRTLFGFIYIALPHAFILFFLGIWSSILTFIAFWAILFTGRYPESFFEYQVKLYRWQLRLGARIFNLADGYPSFGLNAEDDETEFDIEYPENLSRGILLAKVLLGIFYVILPHSIVLFFRMIATYVIVFIAFWAVLFTGKYPANWHSFVTGLFRWQYRVNLYMGLMTDKYPPFTGKELEDEQ
ncbi:MAG: DUF4389 domain-containing protein [Bacteroidetes bacterium]|jgi:hypothetical protein|nr:DUF4389 domain-containing protein [Bacteroidota bacterium]